MAEKRRVTLKSRAAELRAAASLEDLVAVVKEAVSGVRYGRVVLTLYQGKVSDIEVCQRVELARKIDVS